ncbi:TPA: hypothetical protein ACH3X1_013406 [Trebouxia sp. C0004]
MAVKDAPHCETEQAKLERLALCATLSASLPWQWLQNEHVRELFFFVKPTIQLPSRKKLSGVLLDNEHEVQEAEFREALCQRNLM